MFIVLLMKSFRRLVAVFAVGMLLAGVLTITSGCLAVAAGAGAGAVAWVRGDLEASLNARFDRTVNATNKAIEQLGFAKLSEQKDALLGTIVARNAADKKIEIKLNTVADNVTKVRIRVGVIGDEALSMTILEKIKSNL